MENQATNSRLPPLSMTGPRFGRMASRGLSPIRYQPHDNRPPQRISTRIPVPIRCVSAPDVPNQMAQQSGSSASYLQVSEPQAPPLLRRQTTDFRHFLGPEYITTWDADDAERRSTSSFSSVASAMSSIKKFGKRTWDEIDSKLDQRRREKEVKW